MVYVVYIQTCLLMFVCFAFYALYLFSITKLRLYFRGIFIFWFSFGSSTYFVTTLSLLIVLMFISMAIEEHNVQTKDIVNIIDGDGDGDVDGSFLRRLTHPRSVWNGNRFIKAALTVYKI